MISQFLAGKSFCCDEIEFKASFLEDGKRMGKKSASASGKHKKDATNGSGNGFLCEFRKSMFHGASRSLSPCLMCTVGSEKLVQ